MLWLSVCFLYIPAMAGDEIESSLCYRRFTIHDGLSQMQTETIWQDQRGYIYIGTLSGFVRYDGVRITPFLKGKRENIVGFAEVGNEVRALGFRRQWIVEGEKVVMRQLDPQRKWYLNNFNAADLPSGLVLMEDAHEQNRRLCRFAETPKGSIRFLPDMELVTKSQLLDLMTPDRKLLVDRNACYIPTLKGLYRLIGNRAVRLTAKEDFFSLIRVSNTLYALASDGIYQLEGNQLRLCCRFHFESPDYGLFVRSTKNGHLLIADSHHLYLYNGKQTQVIAKGFNMIKNLFVDRWDRLWMATYQGAYCFFNMDFVNYQLSDKDDMMRSLAVDKKGRLVAGTLNGKLLVLNNKGTEIQSFATKDNNFFLPSSATLDGNIYMAGKGDVACFDGKTVNWLGMPDDRYDFVAKANDDVVVGGRKQMLLYHPHQQQADTLTSQIPHPFCAAVDPQGVLWVGSGFGLFSISLRTERKSRVPQKADIGQTLSVTAMKSDIHKNVFFASADSLFLIRNGQISCLNEQLTQLAGHEIRSIHVSPRGYLLVAVMDGLFVSRISNDCLISDVHFFNHENGFTAVEPLKADMAESPDGTVWLASLEEMTSFKPESLLMNQQESTVVKAPLHWWQRWWVWLGVLILLATLIWRISRQFELRRNQRAMDRLYREKKQKELQIGAIRLKTIPHFHSNVLAAIEYYMMNNSVDEASRYLKLYSDFTNMTLSELDKPARSVAEEMDYTLIYLKLEQLRYGDRLRYAILIDDNVDKKVLIPNMLMHTYCQNAIKHGIGNKADGGFVEVHVRKEETSEGESVVVSVQDNGVGRTQAALLNKNSTKQGLRILLEQIALYNQSNKRHIRQKVTDLFDSEGNPAGTCFEMSVPVDFQYE